MKCELCQRAEHQVSFKKKFKKTAHKHPKDATGMVCSNCVAEMLNQKMFIMPWKYKWSTLRRSASILKHV